MADFENLEIDLISKAKSFLELDICHIGFVAKSMSRSLRAWQLSGAEILIPPTYDPIQKVHCALLIWISGTVIEVVAPSENVEKSVVDARLRRGGGIDHICYFSDNLTEDIDKHLQQGAILITPPVYGCVFDRNISFLTHRSGIIIELMDRKAFGKQLRDPLYPII